MRPLLRQRRVIDDKDCAGAPDQFIRLNSEFLLQRRFVPDAARNEMMQLVVVARRQSRRHRLDALAVARANQACHVERKHPPARLVPQPRQERRKPPLEIPIPVRHAAGSANHRAKRSSEILYKLSICQSSAKRSAAYPAIQRNQSAVAPSTALAPSSPWPQETIKCPANKPKRSHPRC